VLIPGRDPLTNWPGVRMQTKRPRHNRKPKRARARESSKSQSVNRAPANHIAEPLPEMPRSPTTSATRRRCEDTSTKRHDRYWWRRHSAHRFRRKRILLLGCGVLYPAWGYDPAYNYYDYDGPVYTYGNLLPDQVILNVQRALKQTRLLRWAL